MVVGSSSDWLPSGFTEKIKVKNGRKIKLDNVGEPFVDPDISMQKRSMKDASCITKPQNKNPMIVNEITSVNWLPLGWRKEIKISKSGNKIRKYPVDILGEPLLKPGLSLQRKSRVDEATITKTQKMGRQSSTMIASETTSVDGLPPGWIKEIKISNSGNKIRKDMYYTDPVSGYIFRSKKDVLRFLEMHDIGSCVITPKKSESDGLKLIKNKTPLDNVGETSLKPDIFVQDQSKTDAGCIPETQNKQHQSFTTVSTEVTSADGLPPGWIKEIKTSQSGDKIRKDPYYTDPVSGYEFRSKKDALRFVETNDIRSCVIKPRKREVDDLKLITNKTPLVPPSM